MDLNQALMGSLAGLTATVPMTLAMEAMHGALPAGERYPLPPREITEVMTEGAGLRGACALRVPPVAGGAAFGLAVWAGSYLGWLPAAGILRPASEHPARRNALMIAAHVVWGATTGLLVDRLCKLKGR
jgi:hypothetical protein